MDKVALRDFFNEQLESVLEQTERDEIFFRLVEHLYSKNRLDWVVNAQTIQIEDWAGPIEQLKEQVPIQYIIGHEWFNGMPLRVNSSVLIPRPETKELIDWVIEKESVTPIDSIIDIGTGSGCIAISLKKAFLKSEVYATDLSNNALAIAKENAISQQADIVFMQDDILNSGLKQYEFDIIVSNPPYILPTEKTSMDKRVLDYEPSIALFTTTNDALQFYKVIVSFALATISENGALYFEVHEQYALETRVYCEKYFEWVELKKDIYGKNRMLRAQKKRSD